MSYSLPSLSGNRQLFANTAGRATWSYQTCINLSSWEVSCNHTVTLLELFSKNYKRTSKTFDRIRTAKKEEEDEEKKERKGRKETQGSQVLLFLQASRQAKPCGWRGSVYVGPGSPSLPGRGRLPPARANMASWYFCREVKTSIYCSILNSP